MTRLQKKHVKRIGIDIAGFGLIILSPFVSLLPGPGGLPVFIAGLGILSLNYKWARRLLQNFEQKYTNFVDKYLVSNKKVARIIDLLSLVIIGTGVTTVLNADHLIFQGFGIGLISFSFLILISNQKRLDRFLRKIKKKRKHSK